ncbi:MAG TPA: GNAT family N-acetyltransferase [Bdellovibrionales bacterium]|nr:GNAT family N-acetyltransferase [Bdellovibrionales bacterium]
MAAVVRLAEISDLKALIEHSLRHQAESGRDGDFVFTPSEEPNSLPFETLLPQKTKSWNLSPTENGWERVWIVTDGEAVFGELTLCHRPPMKATLHRAHLMMGLERSHRSSGYGKQLMQTAIEWAKSQPTLDWVQLYVFDHNEPAKALYRKFGFEGGTTTVDLFRVHGQSINDTEMVLRLRK